MVKILKDGDSGKDTEKHSVYSRVKKRRLRSLELQEGILRNSYLSKTRRLFTKKGGKTSFHSGKGNAGKKKKILGRRKGRPPGEKPIFKGYRGGGGHTAKSGVPRTSGFKSKKAKKRLVEGKPGGRRKGNRGTSECRRDGEKRFA